MRFHINYINLATFWIPIRSVRRSVRKFLNGDFSSIKVQNFLLNKYEKNLKSLIIVLVPEYNTISGGIMSMFSLAKFSEKFINIHKSEVLLMTRPNKHRTTIVYNSTFKNNAIIFRFNQLVHFVNLENLVIHIPEESCTDFYKLLKKEEKEFLLKIKNLQINIMNQNINLMPNKEDFKDLYKLTNNITQTVAHHRYCSQEVANKYELPTSLIPPYTDLSCYTVPDYSEKENLILYSPDKIQLKTTIIEKIQNAFSNYELKEIKDYTFNEFIAFCQRAKYMITFGEGYDGYLAQSMFMNDIGFAVYNNKFFPNEFDFNKQNIFNSYEDMANNIVNVIKYFDNNLDKRKEIIEYFNSIQNQLYSQEIYLNCLKNFYIKQYNFLPTYGGQNVKIHI